MTLPVYVRQAHRIIVAVWLLFIVLALSLEVVGGPESPLVTIPIVVSFILMILTGSYLLVRPWVQRVRAR